MTKSKEFYQEKLAALYDRAWNDESFSARLENDAKAAVEEYVGEMPANVDVKVVRDTGNVKYLHIPNPPVEREIPDADLMQARGGTFWNCATVIGDPATTVIGTSLVPQPTVPNNDF
ncbi:hypothetical protein Q5Y75_18150 [Ruegeria sp. 2205SS24-7]|uniref:hypothetical protein n=1 Tax=Ruegeria discodermiae TaxID=3064389 RepID=UPI0027417144|nr:hypothetical protein [Ruegeria sp. 2205SS24-7]MDP5219146.1 hypothetical protein [Ruegeria sp. 2205SS24-7]